MGATPSWPVGSLDLAHNDERSLPGVYHTRPRAVQQPSHQHRGAKSFVDDLAGSRGVVPSRAAALLRSTETKPLGLDDLSAIKRLHATLIKFHVGEDRRIRRVQFSIIIVLLVRFVCYKASACNPDQVSCRRRQTNSSSSI